MKAPALRKLRSQMKDPRGLIPLGSEALGSNPSDLFPVQEEGFIQDHLRGVTEAVAADLRKIAALPDKGAGWPGWPAGCLGPANQNSPTQGGAPAQSPSGVRHSGTLPYKTPCRPVGPCPAAHPSRGTLSSPPPQSGLFSNVLFRHRGCFQKLVIKRVVSSEP